MEKLDTLFAFLKEYKDMSKNEQTICLDILKMFSHPVTSVIVPKPYEKSKKKNGNLKKTCVICGNSFKTYKEYQVTCCPKCGGQYRAKNRKQKKLKKWDNILINNI